jgi:hypothetical protein
MNWIKLTCTGARRLPVWVNLERIVEIGLFMDEGSSLYPVVTRLYSGDVSASDGGSTYYHLRHPSRYCGVCTLNRQRHCKSTNQRRRLT